jgi:hypothetical protein
MCTGLPAFPHLVIGVAMFSYIALLLGLFFFTRDQVIKAYNHVPLFQYILIGLSIIYVYSGSIYLGAHAESVP